MAATASRPSRGVSTSDGTDVATALRVAVTRIHRALRVQPDFDITPSQVSALSRIDANGPLRLGTLAQLESIAAATMTRVVETLEEKGLIARVADERDGRVSLVEVTPRGAAVLQAMRSAGSRAIHEALDTLSSADQSLLVRALPVLDELASRLQLPGVTR